MRDVKDATVRGRGHIGREVVDELLGANLRALRQVTLLDVLARQRVARRVHVGRKGRHAILARELKAVVTPKAEVHHRRLFVGLPRVALDQVVVGRFDTLLLGLGFGLRFDARGFFGGADLNDLIFDALAHRSLLLFRQALHDLCQILVAGILGHHQCADGAVRLRICLGHSLDGLGNQLIEALWALTAKDTDVSRRGQCKIRKGPILLFVTQDVGRAQVVLKRIARTLSLKDHIGQQRQSVAVGTNETSRGGRKHSTCSATGACRVKDLALFDDHGPAFAKKVHRLIVLGTRRCRHQTNLRCTWNHRVARSAIGTATTATQF